jgi:sialic acid synthase SpsE
MGIGVPCAAVAMGATVIEKHFTLARADGGVDSAFSLEPNELKLLVEETRRAWLSIGEVRYGGSSDEQASIKYRRSIYISKNVSKGETLTADNIRIVRPGFGIEPRYYDLLIGRCANKDLPKGTAMSWEHIG